MRSKTDIAKSVVGFVAGIGASLVARRIMTDATSEEEPLYNRAAVASAQVVVGFMVADTVREYTDNKIDEIVEFWETEGKHLLKKRRS